MAIILNKQNHFVAFDNLAKKKNHEWITYWSMLSVINRVELNFIQKLELLAFYMMLKISTTYSPSKKKNQNLNLQMGSQITNERWRRWLLWIVITMTRKRVKVISSKKYFMGDTFNEKWHISTFCGRLHKIGDLQLSEYHNFFGSTQICIVKRQNSNLYSN